MENRKKLAYVMMQLKLNQNKLAKLLKLSAPTLSKLLLGRYSPPYIKMEKMHTTLTKQLTLKHLVCPEIKELFPELKLFDPTLWVFYKGKFENGDT